ncbi:MAG TPA: hypothetical protein DCL15_10085 [Chloroflexi bacterium]|nr:hypothetical protein [Chloroflexota bacterium]HHW88041.1 hypothetical protein [Chloroflexota bacterium]
MNGSDFEVVQAVNGAFSLPTVRWQAITLGAVYGAGFCFLALAVVNVWAAYDGAVALTRFLLIMAGMLAVLAAPWIGERLALPTTARLLSVMSSLLVIGVAVLYGLWRFGSAAAWLPVTISDNQVAQFLAMVLPINLATLWLAVSERWRLPAGLGVLALLMGVAALVLSGSRGAWLGLAGAAVVAGYFWLRTRLRRRTLRRTAVIWCMDGAMLLLVVAILVLYAMVVAFPALDAQLGVSALGGSAFSRIDLWRNSLPLLEDYFFTGSGLGTAAMVYATYAYLLHVPYLFHAHNFYLQVGLEQGVPALLAWLLMIGATLGYAAPLLRFADGMGRALLLGSIAALTAGLVHGLFDAELYYSALAPLTFMAPAALLWSAATVAARVAEVADEDAPSALTTFVGVVMGVGLPLALAVSFPGAPARWEANLGAVQQTRIELSLYHRPEWSFQDQVRLMKAQVLAPAEALFVAAIALDPTQPTAHRRLGAILLARGEVARAKEHLAMAYTVAPYDRATRQLLGEVLALEGDEQRAVQLWQGLDVSQGQFMVREWWYQAFGQPEQLERFSHAVQSFQRSN